ncbi:MAG: dienelactone hydrolase [Gammaproteobacteria bacterium]|jgi:dienelactone hydrolase
MVISYGPSRLGVRPAVVALHGCGGPINWKSGELSKRHLAWGRILARDGYVVFFPDSFGSRGHRSLCRVKRRPVRSRDRQADAGGAHAWLAQQVDVDKRRIALLGWSNGGTTALRVAASKRGQVFRRIISFYRGSRSLLRRPFRKSVTPLKIIIGRADDWTPAEPCVDLAKLWRADIVLYDDAYHSFDTPNSPVRIRRGMAYSKNGDGVVHVGTHVAARTAAIKEVLQMLK